MGRNRGGRKKEEKKLFGRVGKKVGVIQLFLVRQIVSRARERENERQSFTKGTKQEPTRD